MRILVITDTPLEKGYAGMKLNMVAKTMDALGVEWGHACVFPHMEPQEAQKAKAKDWGTQTERLRLLTGPNTRVLFMGPIALAAYMGWPKAPQISKTEGRGFLVPSHEEDVLLFGVLTYAASTPMKDPEFFRDVLFAVRKLAQRGYPLPEPALDVRIFSEANDELNDLLSWMNQEEPLLGCDIETTGFSPVDDRLLSVGFGTLGGLVVIVDLSEGDPALVEVVRAYLEGYRGTLVFHNVKFDMTMLHRLLGVKRQERLADTMLMHYLLDERSEGKYKAHGLKRLARIYHDDVWAGTEVQDYLDDPSPAKLRDLFMYQARDCYHTARLAVTLRAELEEESPRLVRLHDKFFVPVALAVGRMQAEGILVDELYLEAMHEHLTEALTSDMRSIHQAVYALTGEEEFNPGSAKQMTELLHGKLHLPVLKGKSDWKRKTDTPATDKVVLKTLSRRVREERPEVAHLIDRILSWRQRTKILSTYVDGILARVESDGRVRGDFGLANTATGRISCRKPNLQNLDSRGKDIGADVKAAFVAEPGWVLMDVDYSQLELRVAALYSQDPKLAGTFREGGDVHQTVAWELYHKPKDQVSKLERTLAKTVSFGSIYGLSPGGLVNSEVTVQLAEQYGEKAVWSERQAHQFQERFEQGFRTLYDWIDRIKAHAFRQKYVENPLGFRRRFLFTRKWDRSGVERQAVNTPIQGFAGQLCLWAIVQLQRQLDPEQARVILTVHDSILLEVREEHVDSVALQVREIMRDAIHSLPLELTDPVSGDPLQVDVPFECDVSTGANWSECA
jgi:DNA polymerase I